MPTGKNIGPFMSNIVNMNSRGSITCLNVAELFVVFLPRAGQKVHFPLRPAHPNRPRIWSTPNTLVVQFIKLSSFHEYQESTSIRKCRTGQTDLITIASEPIWQTPLPASPETQTANDDQAEPKSSRRPRHTLKPPPPRLPDRPLRSLWSHHRTAALRACPRAFRVAPRRPLHYPSP